MPVYRLTASSIISSFRVSGKRHLLLTGGRGTGKTTLLRALVPLLCPGAQEITTAAYPADRVEIRESVGGKIAVIGRFDPALPPGENRMRPVADGFLLLGVPALHRMAAGESEWAVLDELGYLENSCPEFRQAVEALLDAKRVLAIVRKQDTPFLTALRARQDAFVVDLDDPASALGCVVMASGLGRRFGGNKLMADFCGAPLIANALALAALPLLACRIVVTRSEEVEALCHAQGVPVLRHAQPYRSDTVRLGLAALLGKGRVHPPIRLVPVVRETGRRPVAITRRECGTSYKFSKKWGLRPTSESEMHIGCEQEGSWLARVITVAALVD